MAKILDVAPVTGRSTGIDIMRTILAMWVVLVHTVPWTHSLNPITTIDRYVVPFVDRMGKLFQPVGETNPAVLAFIVLSGYCIHRNGLRRKSMDVASYAIRRFFRIYPVYVAAIGVGVSFVIFLGPTFEGYRKIVSTDAVSASCILIKSLGLSIFSPTFVECAYQGNAPLRTVAVEMWLYALYPIILMLMAFVNSRVLLAITSAIVVAGVAMVTEWRWTGMWWHNDSLIGYVAYWWIGAKALDPAFSKRLRDWRVFSALLVTWLAISFLVYGDANAAPALIEARKIVFALMLAAYLPVIDRLNIEFKYSETLGRAGYSIYAFHKPVVALMIVLGSPWYLTCLTAYIAGLIMFFLIENPFDRFGRRLAAARRSTAKA